MGKNGFLKTRFKSTNCRQDANKGSISRNTVGVCESPTSVRMDRRPNQATATECGGGVDVHRTRRVLGKEAESQGEISTEREKSRVGSARGDPSHPTSDE